MYLFNCKIEFLHLRKISHLVINANGGGFVSKSKFKEYFATARIACPKSASWPAQVLRKPLFGQNANGGGFVSKSKFKDYFATARIASPKFAGWPAQALRKPALLANIQRVMKSPKYLHKLKYNVTISKYLYHFN